VCYWYCPLKYKINSSTAGAALIMSNTTLFDAVVLLWLLLITWFSCILISINRSELRVAVFPVIPVISSVYSSRLLTWWRTAPYSTECLDRRLNFCLMSPSRKVTSAYSEKFLETFRTQATMWCFCVVSYACDWVLWLWMFLSRLT